LTITKYATKNYEFKYVIAKDVNIYTIINDVINKKIAKLNFNFKYNLNLS